MAATLGMNHNGGTALHPFFARSNGHSESQPTHTATEPSVPPQTVADSGLTAEPEGAAEVKKKGGGKQRKPRKKVQDDGGSQKTLAQVFNPSAQPGPEQTAPQVEAQPLDNAEQHCGEDDNGSRRKRRRTSEITSCEVGDDQQATKMPPSGAEVSQAKNGAERPPSPHIVIPPAKKTEEENQAPSDRTSNTGPATPPKKMLKLNAGGKLASPVGKKPDVKAEAPEPKRRGRPRRAKEVPSPKKLEVSVRYGNEDHVEERTLLGLRIDRIMAGEERYTKSKITQKKPRTPKKPKTTHPFFTGKPKEPTAPKLESTRKMTATTPGKLRSQATQDRAPEPFKDIQSNAGSALLKDRLMVKHPGARDAPWPDSQQLHVRGVDEHDLPKRSQPPARRRKQKHLRTDLDASESIIHRLASVLEPEPEPELRPDGYQQPRDDLRLPEKRIISGEEIAKFITPNIRASLQPVRHSDAPPTASQTAAHPALQSLWRALPNHLSAFDHSTGELVGWAQKYAPVTAQEVLQSSHTMAVLTDWLTALKVNTVSSAAPMSSSQKQAAAKPKKKRRRKNDEMDDFLAPSDEDFIEVKELPAAEGSTLVIDPREPRSTVQVANGNAKLSNAVLLSGPNGCGKTAAAYAVAKELGYQVFEISSAERRSGRDVLDKVGDMTENHIVRHHGADPGELSASEDRGHMETAFQKDLDSGRQGKMNTFFRAKPAVKKEVVKKQAEKKQTLEKLQEASKKPAKDQQQSLILLEEIDILFREDKEFWNTVMKLVATSKRPFIMTCNDEDLVPLQALSLHAILRLGPPLTDLAVDYLLLVAATEGHILDRGAVTSLYESRNRDLRASITELDFWCQMGVGDPKGGLSWIYQRYPPGCDVDEQGRKLRVVSDGSFGTGMGFTHSAVSSGEETLAFYWHEFGLEPTDVFARDLASPETTAEGSPKDSPTDALSLKQMANLTDSLSAMDVYTSHDTMDPSLPELPIKARSHYIEGMALLESNERADYPDLPAKLAVASTLSAHRVFGNPQAVSNALSTLTLLSRIQQCRHNKHSTLTRRAFTCFDPITWPITTFPSSGLEFSALDGPLAILTTDLAPYIRSIAQYDLSLEEQRAQLGGTAEGRAAKRARTTRAARSALEGSQRSSTRRERWFDKELDLVGVLATGGRWWPKTVARAAEGDGEESEGSEVAPGGEEESTVYE